MELKVEGRNLEVRNSWQEKIQEEKDRLVRHHAGLVLNLRVSIEETSQQKQGGHKVKIIAGVPNDTLVVQRKGVNVRTLLTESFDTLGLQLKELQRKRRQTPKVGEGQAAAIPLQGVIKSLSPFESYGFITTMDGRDIYFHENALKGIALEKLSEGDEVRFAATDGLKGPQATWVKAV